jgi:hypothetical protein
MDRVFTAINRAAMPKRVVYSDFPAARAMILPTRLLSSPRDNRREHLRHAVVAG